MAFHIRSLPLSRALEERGYAEPTPVQEAVIAPGTEGRDLLVSARTGSGKTIAYGLAVASTLLGDDELFDAADAPRGLVVAPTRELALQVTNELTWLYARAGARIVPCVGGMDPRAERRRLDAGAHIVVGTPGRLRDHLERGALRIGELKALVLDEADEMLNLGFREDLEFILEATPAERRTLLFSATLPKAIAVMAKRYQREAVRIEVSRGEPAHADIEYRAVRIAPNEMEHAVVNVLRASESAAAIVFCNTREKVRHLSSGLGERGFSVVTLSGELGQAERNQALQALRDGRAQICVATDVAARGIDLPNIGLVIHAELPSDAETLQHRSGRTGRAGRKGVSILLVPISRRRKAERLLVEARIQASWGGAPSAESIRRLDEERLLADPILMEAPGEEDAEIARRLLESRTPEEIAAAFARLYRARLPAPEDVFDPGFGPDPKQGRQPGEGRGERGASKHSRGGPSVLFRLDVGRRNNADPKWLLPLLCRRGRISRDAIGAIRIFDSETKVEIAADFADRFALAAASGENDDITIERADEGETGAPAGRGPKGEGARGKGPKLEGSRGRKDAGFGDDRKGGAGPRKPFKKKFDASAGVNRGRAAKGDATPGGAPRKRKRAKD